MDVTKININSDTKQNNVIKININRINTTKTNIRFLSFSPHANLKTETIVFFTYRFNYLYLNYSFKFDYISTRIEYEMS